MKKQWEDERVPLNKEKISRGLGIPLLKKLDKIYIPSTRYDIKFRGIDVTYFTNKNGEPITVFIGKRNQDGDIVGEHYSRRIKKREEGIIKESHWDNRGRVTRNTKS